MRRLLLKPLDRFFVHPAKRVQLMLHGLFELLNTVLFRVRLIGGRPSIQDVSALLDQLRQPRFHRLELFLRLLPLMKGEAETIELRFELGKPLFEVRTLLNHQ